jgi:hypothetical protein
MGESGRLPDFVIIGAMKSATTSLYRWLDQQPEVFVARSKETRFFTDHWSRGLDWYEGLFADADPAQLVGEASVNYMNPTLAPIAADRMVRTIPDAHLIAVIRHPVERIRSHYRHEVQRRRESRPLVVALSEPGNTYLDHSMYQRSLRPYIDRYRREQLTVVRFEDLVRPPASAWSTALRSLSLSDRPLPETALNVSEAKGQWSSVMAWAKRNHLISLRTVSRLPAPVRRAGRTVFAHGGLAYEQKLAESRVPIPDGLLTPVWDDLAALESWLGTDLWAPPEQQVRVEMDR